ncbi:MAG: aminotransferase class V-fold PLP-dependent enzyme [Lachnospiraceae bacterium]|nr:aminotransferase class V-fold PLP-dependent enzyme [Lachnospiraceae bacterium]
MILGGGQQLGLRAGTLNTIGIVGTTVAAENAYKSLNEDIRKLKELRDYAIDELSKINDKYGIISFNTCKDETFAPHIVSVSFKGIRAEVMLHALEEKNIYVSAGSACSSHDKTSSSTLRSIGLNKDIAESTIRLSFGKYNKKEEVDYFIDKIDEIIPKLRI